MKGERKLRKLFSGIVLALLLPCMLTVALNVRPVKSDYVWNVPIYILADGSISPSTAPIQRNGNYYTLTGNITSLTTGIIVQKRNITIDGAGYTLQGSGSGDGFNLDSIDHVTIKNAKVANFTIGIDLTSSSNYNTVSGNNITANKEYGIYLYSSNNNALSGNNIANNGNGVGLDYSSNNVLSRNSITNNQHNLGIQIELLSNNNTLSGNNIANNLYGVGLDSSTGNTLSGNNIAANSFYGIRIDFSSGNLIIHNNFISNINQAYLYASFNAWDDGFTGNYWSDYLLKYPSATEIDRSGIWNTPYVIDAHNIDYFPLLNEDVSGTALRVVNAATGSSETVALLHDSFTINVSIDNGSSDLGGYQFTLVWNASILNCTGYSITPPQEWGNNTFIGADQLNRTNPDGTQSYDTFVYSTLYGINVGSEHVVNTLYFTVVGTGETPLALGNVVLGGYDGNDIPVTRVSGVFRTFVIPEYPSFIFLPLFMIATIIAAAILGKRRLLVS